MHNSYNLFFHDFHRHFPCSGCTNDHARARRHVLRYNCTKECVCSSGDGVKSFIYLLLCIKSINTYWIHVPVSTVHPHDHSKSVRIYRNFIWRIGGLEGLPLLNFSTWPLTLRVKTLGVPIFTNGNWTCNLVYYPLVKWGMNTNTKFDLKPLTYIGSTRTHQSLHVYIFCHT